MDLLAKLNVNNNYEEELRRWAKRIPFSYVRPFFELVENDNTLTVEESEFLLSELKYIAKYFFTTVIPFSTLTLRIVKERPEEILAVIVDVPQTPLISTFGELYDIFEEFPLLSANKLIGNIEISSSIRSKLVTAFQNSDKVKFCEVLENVDIDLTPYINRIYRLYWLYSLFALYEVNTSGQSEASDDTDFDVFGFLHNFSREYGHNLNSDRELYDLGLKFSDCFGYFEKVDSFEDLFIKCKAVIRKFGVDYFRSSLQGLLTFYVVPIISIYLKIEPNLRIEENRTYNSLMNNSPYLKEFNELCTYVESPNSKNDVLQLQAVQDNEEEGKDCDIEYFNNLTNRHFLPTNFFDKKIREKEDKGQFIGILKDSVINKGKEKLEGLVNFLADNNYINSDDKTKLNLAFRLTGFHKEFATEKTEWNGSPNILAHIIHNFYESGKKWKNAKTIFPSVAEKLHSGTKIKTTDQKDRDFEKLFDWLYGDK